MFCARVLFTGQSPKAVLKYDSSLSGILHNKLFDWQLTVHIADSQRVKNTLILFYVYSQNKIDKLLINFSLYIHFNLSTCLNKYIRKVNNMLTLDFTYQ